MHDALLYGMTVEWNRQVRAGEKSQNGNRPVAAVPSPI